MKLDDLDHALLSHFASRFPKPSMVDFCEYDIAKSEVVQLCTHPRPFEIENLVNRFVCHNRWGMFGDWRDFPTFAGDVAVWCRRESLTHEQDLAFFFLHLSPAGLFGEPDLPLLRQWIEDILDPPSQLRWPARFYWEEHALDYLALLHEAGGQVDSAVARNVERSQAAGRATPLCIALRGLLGHDDQVAEERITRHFGEMASSCDNQNLPTRALVAPSSVQDTIATLRKHSAEIGALALD